jgi:hypothetical protein
MNIENGVWVEAWNNKGINYIGPYEGFSGNLHRVCGKLFKFAKPLPEDKAKELQFLIEALEK